MGTTLSPMVIALIVVGIGAIIVSGLTVASMVRHRAVLRRARGEVEEVIVPISILGDNRGNPIVAALSPIIPSSADDPALRAKLLRAGIDSRTAPQAYFLFRVLSLAVFPVLALLIAPRTSTWMYYMSIGLGLYIGFIAPLAMLDRMVRIRQERITRSVPDALDLLVVCVEAGISLDAALLRVSRELRFLHPDLADEFAVVMRVSNAGMTREVALRGLWDRTGVPELRSIATSMIQSEKLGSSIASVLRVASDTLRTKRRQSAEKRAKQAPLKMTFPLLFFILPPLFVVVLGPPIFKAMKEFAKF